MQGWGFMAVIACHPTWVEAPVAQVAQPKRDTPLVPPDPCCCVCAHAHAPAAARHTLVSHQMLTETYMLLMPGQQLLLCAQHRVILAAEQRCCAACQKQLLRRRDGSGEEVGGRQEGVVR